ncbi:ATP-dependent Clp protease ATP-binding subunit ClpA [Clostridium beijerinckii]|uniref:ATP-dependent Clp protease ATP-binding subunit ClpA n=1 Tax=Clostridium beijerinckii TaxID=1520 RepID=A0A1S8S206_CLOBE|nr:ATP-dependent Clp protease ATP-binding subunit ClpA [Clostridium beijerinckii]NMF04117.1 ATP-dependent Clp protease ATP-binding subunit ClpA [Clostridium beijerinckii]NRY59891.1 ATP-dependent Clp protease ATP-binding subunit ClpA [Clostridium beijerinckii]OOM59476.1 ATP-dependent Clp protease ATP-binding subunit ClpA [Clostridium beijerinckii]
MKITNEVNLILLKAYQEAKEKSSEYITPEHLLYAATFDKNVEYAIKECGGSLENLRYNLATYVKTYINKIGQGEPQESIEFQRVILTANEQIKYSGKDAIDVDHILSAIFNLEDSYARYYLEQEGVTRRDLLYSLCHSIDEDTRNSYDDEMQENFKEDENEFTENESKEKVEKKKEDAFLNKFTIDLIKKVREEENDPLIGRKDILERSIQILCRRIKNNPIHVGESGVGKTAITLGLAKLISEDKVPEKLKGSSMFSLDIGSVIAGTKYRGDFEERIKRVLDLISKQDKPIVYIDEIHNIVGAGALNGGALDASNLLKPYLTEGKIRFIGATTFDEYKKFFEKDKALSRRFQRIDVKEPSIKEAIQILDGLKKNYEEYHNVSYTDEAIGDAVTLSDKYINDRYLPDKAVDIIDEAGAYVRMHNEDMNEQIIVDRKTIEEIISKICNIPKQTVESSEITSLKHLEKDLKENIFSQDKAIEEVVRCIKMSRSGLNDEDKPVASMLFVGPTGVGKTEIARCLSKTLGIDLIRFDMSEYTEKHSAAKLIGSPPGYVGYEEGGLLTDSIRKTPHCVLLLDEIEKAHPDILSVLLQVMDYATLTDNKGRKADFRNSIIIMTSNAGARNIGKKLIGFGDREVKGEAIMEEVKKFFTPEFRNRLDKIIVFNGMTDAMAANIAKKQLNDFKNKLSSKNVKIEFSEECVNHVAKIGTSEEFGAREIARVIASNIKPLLVDEILFGKLSKGGECIINFMNEKFELKIN